jgi:hypothetical protein
MKWVQGSLSNEETGCGLARGELRELEPNSLLPGQPQRRRRCVLRIPDCRAGTAVKSASRTRRSSLVPMATTTSPSSKTASGEGVVPKLPSRLGSETIRAPVRCRRRRSGMAIPHCRDAAVTAISSQRRGSPPCGERSQGTRRPVVREPAWPSVCRRSSRDR